MQANLDMSSSPSLHSYYDQDQFSELAAKVSEDFDSKVKIINLDESHLITEENEEEDEDENEENDDDDDDDFSFVFNGSDTSPISADDVFQDGQIRPVFPLFNQKLLLADEDYKISENRLPLRPPVKKVFIETPPSSSSSSETTDEVNRIATGPYCAWTKTSPELSKKSNSTGFSKLWRFKEYMHRSHSDGRDAFVFLNNAETKKEEKVVQKKTGGEGSSDKKAAGEVKVNAVGGKRVVKKGQKTTALSAHEIYLRNKGYNTEEDKRRSYLPYRPELVGFFTNVSGGGLSRNVHPY